MASHDYTSVFNANHTNIPSSPRSLLLRRYLTESASSAPVTYFDYTQDPLVGPGDEPHASTLEFRVPLLPPGPSFSEFQSNTPLSQSTESPWAHWYEIATGVVRDKGALTQAPVYATVSIPLPGPAPAATSAPSLLEHPVWLMSEVATDTTSSSPPCTEDEVMKAESPALSLHEICHVESSRSGLDSLALPVPVVALNSPDLLNPRPPCPKNDTASPSADYMTPTWNYASSIPPLSYGSFSGSESHTLSASSSFKKMSVSELLRPSPGPPLGFGTPEQSSTSSLVGLYADVNMREVAWRSKSPAVCVNPADVMTGSLMYPSPTMDLSPVLECKEESPLSPVALLRVAERSVTPPPRSVPSPVPDYISDFPQEGLVDDEDFPDEAISAIVSVLQTTVKSEHQHTPIPAAVRPTETCLKENQPLYPQHAQVYPGNATGMSHYILEDLKAPGPSTQHHKRVPLADLPIPQPEYTGPPHTSYYSYGAHQHPTTYTFAPPPPPAPVRAPAPGPPLSPVLNAHTGISLEELRQRANDYRTRHEGADLDKNFLQCFAGRLSARGEMLDEYRCYVTGCEQRNKRRDHILVHVGAHVEHRPWMCRHCGMRFLRKNECKRHEAGHGGRKPFSCSLCAPYQEKSFVRQDLLKRHLRVAHGAQGTVARKKKGVYKDEDEDYWP